MNKLRAYFNNFFWLFLTYLSAPFFYCLIFLLARRSLKGEGGRKNIPLKILVIQTAKIGDLVCTTPVFRGIKKKFPSSYLAVLATSRNKDILKNNPRVDELILIDDYPKIWDKLKLFSKLKKEKYDWTFAMLPDSFNNIIAFWSLVPNRAATIHKYSGETAALTSFFNNHRLEYKRHAPLMKHYLDLLKFIGIEKPSEEKEIFILPEEEKKASDFLKAQNLDSHDLLIGISVTSGVKIKEWEPSRFAVLADKLIEEKNAKIIFVGSADDRPKIEKVQKMMQESSVNAAGFFKLYELPALLQKLELFISVDNGPLHMADAVGVLVVDIVGPIDTNELYPLNERSKIIKRDIDCAPCSFMFQPPLFCKEGHFKCLKEITPEEVFEAAVKLIEV